MVTCPGAVTRAAEGRQDAVAVFAARRGSPGMDARLPKVQKEGKSTMLILLIILLLVLGGGGGYYGHSRWGYGGSAGIGLGTILLIVLVAYLLGGFN
jgi:hypothetical protein